MRKNNSTNTNKTIEILTKENIRLYTENTQLKLELSKYEAEQNIKNNHTKSSTTKKKKVTNTKKKNNDNNKKTNNKKSTLSEFQQNREKAKTIVADSRKNNVDITEIAKLINKSEPTVRKYLQELKAEGRL